MPQNINAHLDKMASEARAAGMSYGKYVAQQAYPVTIIVPDYLKSAPTMWERLAGAIPPPAPVREKKRKGKKERAVMPSLPPRPNVDANYAMELGYAAAPWLRPKRRVAGLSLLKLADICGVSHQTIWRWERTERVPEAFAEYVSQVLDAYINFGNGR